MKRLFVILLMIPFCAIAEGSSSPKDMANEFLGSVIEGDISNAYDRLLEGSEIPVDKPQDVKALKQQTESGLPLYGKPLGYELVREQRFGNSVVRLLYLLKSEKGPIVWDFYFYKPMDSWVLASVDYSVQLQRLVQ